MKGYFNQGLEVVVAGFGGSGSAVGDSASSDQIDSHGSKYYIK